MSLIGNTPKTFDKKRIIDHQTLLKQQVTLKTSNILILYHF